MSLLKSLLILVLVQASVAGPSCAMAASPDQPTGTSDSNGAWAKAEVNDLVVKNFRGTSLARPILWKTHVKANVAGPSMPVEKALKVLEQVKKRLLLFNVQPEFRIQMGTGDGSENVVFYLTENIFALSRNSPDYDGEIFRIVEKTLGGPAQARAVVDFYQQNQIPCFGAVGALDVAVANQHTPIHGSIQLIWIIESSQDLTAIDRCVVLGIGRAVGLLGAISSETPSIFNPNFMPETPTQQDLWLIRQMLGHRWFDVTLEGIRRKIYADPTLN